MKIGIFTYFDGCNFGEQLQAYTSQKYFEALGHDVWLINYSKDKEEYNYGRYPCEQAGAHRRFADTKLKTTKRLSQDEIFSFVTNNHFDVVAFGADAIWNKRNRINLQVYTAQWLDKKTIEKGMKVIAVSPAFMGNTYSDLTNDEKESFRKGLLNFTFINVRDEWTKEIVNKEIMGCDYIKLLNPDPVFLLNEFCDNRWNNPYKNVSEKSYYVLSLPADLKGWGRFLMERWLKKLRGKLHAKGYLMVELPLPDGVSGLKVFDMTVPYPIDPIDWFLWLKNAKAFVGLRFHAIVSCVSAGTPFFSLDVYGNCPRWLHYLNRLGFHKWDRKYNTGSKIRNLLEGSNLEQYRINGALPNSVNPHKLVKIMESFDVDALSSFREKNIELFKSNMRKALS